MTTTNSTTADIYDYENQMAEMFKPMEDEDLDFLRSLATVEPTFWETFGKKDSHTYRVKLTRMLIADKMSESDIFALFYLVNAIKNKSRILEGLDNADEGFRKIPSMVRARAFLETRCVQYTSEVTRSTFAVIHIPNASHGHQGALVGVDLGRLVPKLDDGADRSHDRHAEQGQGHVHGLLDQRPPARQLRRPKRVYENCKPSLTPTLPPGTTRRAGSTFNCLSYGISRQMVVWLTLRRAVAGIDQTLRLYHCINRDAKLSPRS